MPSCWHGLEVSRIPEVDVLLRVQMRLNDIS
jgi:hypothetical protein